MVARLLDDTFSRGLQTAHDLLGHPEFTDQLATEIRKEGGADKAIEALLEAFGLEAKNPFARPAEELLAELSLANIQQHWGIPQETFDRLAAHVPVWPKGPDSFLSFRIRFGKGDAGVEQTLEAHAAYMERRFEAKFERWTLIRSDAAHLRLSYGNYTHTPTVEWIYVHLNTCRTRRKIQARRGECPLADEGLVLAWLYPQRIEAIDYRKWHGLFCAGYEMHVPERDGSWQFMLAVHSPVNPDKVKFTGNWISPEGSVCTMPVQ